MARIATRITLFWKNLGHSEKLFVLVLILEVTNEVLHQVNVGPLPFKGFIDLTFIILASTLLLKYFLRLTRRFVWRIRNRLIVAYIFIGVVPVLLILAMLTVGLYVLMGQVATYLLTRELQHRNEIIRDCASILGWQAAEHFKKEGLEQVAAQTLLHLQSRVPTLQAIIRIDNSTFKYLGSDAREDYPSWSRPGFIGLVRVGSDYILAAHTDAKIQNHMIEVFAFEPLDPDLLSNLLPELATVNLLELEKLPEKESVGQESREHSSDSGDLRSSGKRSSYVISVKGQRFLPSQRSSTIPLPPAKSWWDMEVRWGTVVPYSLWDNSQLETEKVVFRVDSRPSLIVRKLFSVLGPLSSAVFFLLYVIGGLLLVAEILSLSLGVSLTKTITRSVADLYEGTLRINSGDFSHRIPLRSKDQLSELASSFNRMTDSVQKLILESKEKERLESELEIAREVQSQLFPLEIPQLQNLQLVGSCQPARMVSGDYYDFMRIDLNWTALAMGDVAGKGISAALLMASIQSSLRAQLNSRTLPRGPGDADGLPLLISEMTTRLNQQLYEITSSEKYATFFCALVNDCSGQLFYTNAGHLPPLLIRNQQAHKLDIHGMVLGAFPNQSYGHGNIELQPGDLLVAYTDGITEPENEYGEEFGEIRLAELLVQNANQPFAELTRLIAAAVRDWSATPEQQDDMTLLMLRRI
jgi:sigma-B regulation protein RsbU (phosphoserine phosphatase)